MTLINTLLSNQNKQTVFTLPEVSALTKSYQGEKLYSALKYAVRTKHILRLREGIYTLDNLYNKLELANKYRSPSYISLYTVLQTAGVVFQPYESIYAIAKRSEKVMINHQQYIYRKIKDDCLLNPIGLVQKNGVMMATPERAIADKIYLDGDEYFDNLRSINWELMKEINSRVYFNHSIINMFITKNQP